MADHDNSETTKLTKRLKLLQSQTSSISDAFARNQDDSLKKNNLKNILVFVRMAIHPYGDDILKFNEFSNNIELISDKQVKISSYKFYSGEINNNFIKAIISYASDTVYNYQIKPDLAVTAIEQIAHENSYNPLTDYLDSALLHWDKQPRIHTFMHKYLGVKQTDFNARMFKLWLVGAVAKAYKPDTQFDEVLLLQGSPASNKTTFFRKIAVNDQFYTDSVTDFTNKDNYKLMVSHWIVNDDEIKAKNRSGIDAVKSLVTQTHLEFRLPYDKLPQKYPAAFVIGMTTNEPQPLKDKTGDRRFMVLHPDKDQRETDIHNLTVEDIKQLWGEAVYSFNSGYSFRLSSKEEEQLAKEQEIYTATDEATENIEQAISNQPIGKHYKLTELTDIALGDDYRYASTRDRRKARNEVAMIFTTKSDWKRSNVHNIQRYTKIK